jgi:hypothetical protein
VGAEGHGGVVYLAYVRCTTGVLGSDQTNDRLR